jgi:predicted ester cyclase
MSLLQKADKFFAAMNARNLDEMAAMISPHADVRTPIGDLTGPQEYREWIEMHFRAFPDFTHELRGIAVESDTEQTLAFELHATGTHTGSLTLPSGDVPPTGRRIDVPAADFWKFADGLIVEYHLYFNLFDFLSQLGLVDQTAGAGGPR